MFVSSRQRGLTRSGRPEINLAPLIDMVFILLIFFLVTTTFVRDRGLDVTPAAASAASQLPPAALRLAIGVQGDLYLDGETILLDDFRRRVEKHLVGDEQGLVVLVPDASLTAGRLVEVMNAAKISGAKNIAVATRSGFGSEGGR